MTTRGQRLSTRHRLRALAAAVALLVPIAVLARPAEAAPGDLDGGFGTGGVGQGPDGAAKVLARQADGKLVVGGVFLPAATPNQNWRLARFNADGTLDTSFGVGGTVDVDRGAIEDLNAVAIQPLDGKILAGGYTFVQNADFTVMRFNTNGTLDATFGVGGVATFNMANDVAKADWVNALAVQADGQILAGGYVANTTSIDFGLVRLNANGTLDNTFDGDGKVITDIGAGRNEAILDLAIVSGGIVALGCGGSDANGNCDRFALAKYTTTGALDASFGTGGVTVGPQGAVNTTGALGVQPDGKLVGAGVVENPTTNRFRGTLARFTATGALDTGFGSGGVVTGPEDSIFFDVALQGDGRIVVAGQKMIPGGIGQRDFLVARYDTNGSLDPSFGEGGVSVNDMSGNQEGDGDLIASVLVIPADAAVAPGKIVAAGRVDGKFVVARYETTGGGEVANLSVGVTDGPDPVASGGELTYTTTVANAGPQTAYRVKLTQTLPAGSEVVSTSATQGACTPGTATVTCSLNSLAAGASATVTIKVSPGPLGPTTTTATVTTSSSDPNPANNTASTTTTVSPGAGAWTGAPALGSARTSPAAVLADGRILMAGGASAPGVALNTAVIYDPATGTVTPTANLGTARGEHTLTTLANGKVLAAGGVTTSGTKLASAEVWDPAGNNGAGTWAPTPNMATGHSEHTAELLSNGKVLVVGGVTLAGDVCPGPAGIPNSAELYDPATNTWAATGNLVYPRIRHTTTRLNDGTVLAVGGYLGTQFAAICGTLAGGQQNAPVELYDPATGTWSQPQNTSIPRHAHSATLLGNGKVLVAGGYGCNSLSCPTTSTEVYDPAAPANQRWSGAAQLPRARGGHRAIRLSDGRVLVAAGVGTPDGSSTPPYVRASALYDPGSNTWAPAGMLATGRTAPAVAQSYGRLLVIGGNTTTAVFDSVELWTPRPVVTSISPTSGPGPGGTTVTVTGTALATVSTASFGTAATSAVVPDPVTPDTKTTVVSPGTLNLAGGTVDVVLTSPGGPSATAGTGNDFSFGSFGYIRATTNPAVPAQITVDGQPANTWGTNWVATPTGSHQVCFRRDIEGFTTPACQTVNVAAGATTEVQGTYAPRGFLQVGTAPCCLNDAVISVKAPGEATATPRDNGTLYTDFAPGTYQVCWGPVANLAPPACQNVNVTAGQLSTVIGTYTSSPGAPGPPAGDGFLRVTTSPAVPAQIVVDGIARNTWSLNWLRIAPGAHTVCFARDIEGFTTPACQTVNVTAAATTTVVGTYVPRGFLLVGADPCCQPATTISVNGVVRDNQVLYTDLAPATYGVCWGTLPNRTAPACQNVNVTAGQLTTVIGTYG